MKNFLNFFIALRLATAQNVLEELSKINLVKKGTLSADSNHSSPALPASHEQSLEANNSDITVDSQKVDIEENISHPVSEQPIRQIYPDLSKIIEKHIEFINLPNSEGTEVVPTLEDELPVSLNNEVESDKLIKNKLHIPLDNEGGPDKLTENPDLNNTEEEAAPEDVPEKDKLNGKFIIIVLIIVGIFYLVSEKMFD